MRQDAEKNADVDMQKKELVEIQNGADQLLYAGEKSLHEHGDKVSDDIKKNVQEKIDALKAARNGTDIAAIKSASEQLSSAMSTIGQSMSQNQQPQQDQTPPEDSSK